MLLAGDIGGTKTTLALFSPGVGPRSPMAQATFPSRAYDGLDALVREFLDSVSQQVDCAVFGVAGPVDEGRAALTNLPWTLDQDMLQEQLGLSSVWLINDLVATASAIPWLADDDLYTLKPGTASAGGTMALLAPGTGLGEAYLIRDGGYRAFPSEGGHADFAPTDRVQRELLEHLHEQGAERVSYEDVCSGRAIPQLYAYLKARGDAEEPPWLADELADAGDPTPIIVQAAVADDRSCGLCTATLDLFMAILGAEAGNLALRMLATGGVYLGGGIPPRICAALATGPFLNAFQRKMPMSTLVERIPIYVICNPKAALLGAACYGLTHGLA